MARLAGVDIPRDKRVEVALTYIYGVGRTRALKTLADTEISGEIRVKDLTDDQLIALRDYVEGNFKVEGDLRRTDSAPRPTLVPARARSAPSPARRRPDSEHCSHRHTSF